MGTKFIQDFLRDIKGLYSSGDFTNLANRFVPIINPQFKVHLASEEEISKLCSKLHSPWDSLFHHTLVARFRLLSSLFVEAFEAQEEGLKDFLRNFQFLRREHLPILYVMIKELRGLATLADRQKIMAGKEREYLERSTQTITKAFSTCLNDKFSSTPSFVWGVYGVANALFSIYLKLNSFNLYKSILRSLDAAGLRKLEEYPVDQQITFRYYLGRYEFFNEDFVKAKEQLNQAFKMCPVHHHQQRRQIMAYLLPVMLHLGKLPRIKLLDQFPELSSIYKPVVDAIRQGHLEGLEKAIEKNERYLLDRGAYLIMEKTKDLASRELVRATYNFVGTEARLNMEHVHTAFKFSSGLPTFPYDEVECLLAVLLHKKYIAGYISHERRILVLSKAAPFPKISTD